MPFAGCQRHMQVFKPTYRLLSGELRRSSIYQVRFRDRKNVRRQVLAFMDKAASEELGRRLDQLVATVVSGVVPDAAMRKWLEGLSPALRKKLLDWELLEPGASALSTPLTDHVNDYHEALIVKARTKNHADLVRTRLLNVIEGCGFAHWLDIDRAEIERWLAGQRKSKRLSQRTTNHYVGAIKAFANWMVAEGRAADSPVSGLGTITVTDAKERGAFFTIEQIRALLAATSVAQKRYQLTGPERVILYLVALETAVRANELRTLTRADFHLDAKPPTVTVRAAHAKNRRRGEIPLCAGLVCRLREYLAVKAPGARAFNVPHYTAKMIRADLASAGLATVDADDNQLDFHSLRHTTGSWLAASGVPLKVIQQILRHSTFGLTADRYTHVELEVMAEALAKMPDIAPQQSTGTARTIPALSQQDARIGADLHFSSLGAPEGGQRANPTNEVQTNGSGWESNPPGT